MRRNHIFEEFLQAFDVPNHFVSKNWNSIQEFKEAKPLNIFDMSTPTSYKMSILKCSKWRFIRLGIQEMIFHHDDRDPENSKKLKEKSGM